MGAYKYIKKLWQKPKQIEGHRDRLVEWRQQPVTVRLEKPTRLDRARELGYKAKQGFLIVRQRVGRGGHTREQFAGGRRSKKFTNKQVLHLSYQSIAERRANAKYKNCEVLASYWVAKDGKNYWYEVILVDRNHPVIVKDPKLNWISQARGRAFRGKTNSQRKTRGLRRKGIGAEKVRPSLRANKGKLH